MTAGGIDWPGTDYLRVVTQVAADLHRSAESIFWQVDAFLGRNKAVAGRKISECIDDGDWQRLAKLLTIDNRYMRADRMQSPTVAFESPVCDAITRLTCENFDMIVDRQEEGVPVEWVTASAEGEEEMFELSTPFLDVPKRMLELRRVDSTQQECSTSETSETSEKVEE